MIIRPVLLVSERKHDGEVAQRVEFEDDTNTVQPDANVGASSFAELFASALTQRRLTLKGLAKRLVDAGDPVSMATLSYWRSGQRRPSAESMHIVRRLEELLDVDGLVHSAAYGGTGTALGTEPLRIGRPSFDEALEETEAALGFLDDPFIEVLAVVKHVVSREWNSMRLTVQSTSRVEGGTQTDKRFVFMGSSDPDARAPRVIATSGLTLEEMYAHPGGEVYGFRFAIDEPAPRGGYVHHSETIEMATTTNIAMYGCGEPPTREIVHVLEFDPDGIPDWLELQTRVGGEVTRTPVPIAGRHTFVDVRRGFGPGEFGWEWGRGERPVVPD